MRTDTIIPIRVRRFLAALILPAIVFALAACGGGGGGGIGISFTPATYSVAAGGSIPLSVTVTGTADLSVTWSVQEAGGGSVSTTGVYTAPATPGIYHVQATSVADTTKSAVATITVTSLALGSGTAYSGVFTNVSSMKVSRTNHTATLLANGNVLVAGGVGISGAAINGAELFNPKAVAFGHFSSIGTMTSPRAYHSATLLMNGKVLVAGGINNTNQPQVSAELYDPATNQFTATGAMSAARWLHTATLLGNGKVLITGGNSAAGPGIDGGAPLQSAEIYDPVTGRFTTVVASMVQPRYYHTATLLQNGMVLLSGGQGRLGQKLPDTELFNPTTASFSATGSMLVDPAVDTGRWLHTATLLRDGSVFVSGGDGGFIAATPNYLSSAQTFMLTATGLTGNFSDLAAMMTFARAHHTAVTRVDGNVLIAGGIGTDVTAATILPSDFLASAELYSPGTKTFALTGAMNVSRANHTATLLANGRILVTGGNQGGTFLKSAEIYQ